MELWMDRPARICEESRMALILAIRGDASHDRWQIVPLHTQACDGCEAYPSEWYHQDRIKGKYAYLCNTCHQMVTDDLFFLTMEMEFNRGRS